MKQKLLLIVADADLRFRVRAHLEEQGFVIFVTDRLHEAIELLQRHTPTIVVAERALSGTMLSDLIAIRQAATRPKLIGIGSHDWSGTSSQGACAGFDEVLRGSATVAVLTKAVLRHSH